MKYNSTLARYFEKQDRYLAEEKRKPNTRKLVEQPWQQTKAEMWDDVTNTLCDLLFIEAKIVNSMTYELIDDYNTVLKVLPEAQEEVRKEEEHQARVKKYTDDMIAYASKWNEARKMYSEDPIKYPMPKDQDIPLPEIIQSVEPWSDEKRKKETERIINNPTRLDKVRAYSQFVISESSAFTKYGTHPGFVIQHSYNNADYPPLVRTVSDAIDADKRNVLFLQKFRNQEFNPFPALIIKNYYWSNSVAITADGKKVITGGRDSSVRMWDLESGQCLKVLRVHRREVDCVSITIDGTKAISGSRDSSVCLWDLENETCLKILKGHNGDVESVSITPDGKRAVSGSKDHTIRLWDLESGECLEVCRGFTNWILSVSIAADGKRVAIGNRRGFVHLFELENAVCIKDLKENGRFIDITPDGSKAVSVGYDKTLKVWDLEKKECLKELKGHTGSIKSVSITADGKRAVTGSEDRTIRLWDLERGICLKVFEGHTSEVDSVSITPDGKKAVTGSEDRTIRLWDLEKGLYLGPHEEAKSSISLVGVSNDGDTILSIERDNTLRLWNPKSGESWKALRGQPRDVQDEYGHNRVQVISVSSNTKKIVTCTYDSIYFWDLLNSTCVRLPEYYSGVQCSAITPDGKRVCTGRYETLHLWDFETGACLNTLKGHTFWTSCITISPDGRSALSGSQDKTIRLWDLESGKCLKLFKNHTSSVFGVNFTPDGKRVVSGCNEMICLWDLEGQLCLNAIERSVSYATSCDVTITPEGRGVVSSINNETLCLWDLRKGNCLQIFEGSKFFLSIIVTPDNKKIISGSRDSTVRFWDMEKGTCLSIFRTNSELSSFTYSNKRNYIITGEVSGNVRILQPTNIVQDFQKSTIQRLWLFGNLDEKGKWDQNITSLCQFCGTRFKVHDRYISLIKDINKDAGITPDMSPCLSLPDEAFENPGLLSECPFCKKPIKFNPFIVDNRDNEFYNK